MSLAVLLMLEALDVDLGDGLAALAAFEPLEGRGAERGAIRAGGAFTLIDESYNANPISMAAALATLGAAPAGGAADRRADRHAGTGRRRGRAYHAGLAAPIEAASVDLVFCAGPLMKSLWDALPPTRRGGYAETAAELAPQLVRAVEPGDVVMVKGSNGSKAGALAAALAALDAATGGGAADALSGSMSVWRRHHDYVPVLNLLRYLTFRAGMAVFTAQLVVVAMGSRFIRWMQAKQGKGQPIRADGIERHIVEKAGTPTMGGLMILAGLWSAPCCGPTSPTSMSGWCCW